MITAKAYGPNANKPIPVRVGNSEQKSSPRQTRFPPPLCISTIRRAAIYVDYRSADPQSTNEGNILGHAPRQLGIGMVDLKVVKATVDRCRARLMT